MYNAKYGISIKSYYKDGTRAYFYGNMHDELLLYYKTSKYFGQNVVFDGVICFIDLASPDQRELVDDTDNILNSLKRKRKTYKAENIKYTIFDFLKLDEFTGKIPSHDYSFRRDQLYRNFFGLDNIKKFVYLNIIFATIYSWEKIDRLTNEYLNTKKWSRINFTQN